MRKKLSLLLVTLVGVILLATVLLLLNSNQKQISKVSLAASKKEVIPVHANTALTGKGIPNASVQIYISPSTIDARVETDKDGNWFYTIPASLSKGKYLVSVTTLDAFGKIAAIHTYRIQVKGKGIFSILQSMTPFAFAQEDEATEYDWERIMGDDWYGWLAEMNASGQYPVIENGSMIIYSQAEYEQRYCVQQDCVIINRTNEAWSNMAQTADSFLRDLEVFLPSEGYAITALLPYFPELAEHQNIEEIEKAAEKTGLQTEIDEDTLNQAIRKVYLLGHYPERSTYMRILNTLDPIIATRSMYNIATGYKYRSASDYINTASALLTFVPILRYLGKGVASTSGRLLVDYTIMMEDAHAIEAAVRYDGAVSYRAVRGRVPSWSHIGRLPPGDAQPIMRTTRPFKTPPSGDEARIWFNKFSGGVATGHVTDISQSYIMTGVYNKFESMIGELAQRTGRNIPANLAYLKDIVDNGYAYAVDSKYLLQTTGYDGGFRSGKMIVIGTYYYDSPKGLSVIFHESTHTLKGAGGHRGFNYVNYKASQASEHDRFLSGLYELFTEAWVDVSRVGFDGFDPASGYFRGGYGSVGKGSASYYDFAQVYQELSTRILWTRDQYGRAILNKPLFYDFLEFAASGDATTLLARVKQYPEVVTWMQQNGIRNFDGNIFDRFLQQQKGVKVRSDFRQASETPTEFKYLVAGGVGFAIIAATTAAKAEELPDEFYEEVQWTPDVLLDVPTEESGAYKVHIIDVGGKIEAGGQIYVNSVITQDGATVSDTSGLSQIWSLAQGGTSLQTTDPTCVGNCSLVLPTALYSDTYSLTTKLVDPNTGNEIASDSIEIYVGKERDKEVTSLRVNDTDIDLLSSSAKVVAIDPANRFFVVTVTYKDGTTKDQTVYLKPKAGNAQDLRCPEDKFYCDEKTQKNIHKYGGIYDGESCIYNFEPTGPCSTKDSPSQASICKYNETCSGGIRSCTGTLQEGICKYDPNVSPNCSACQADTSAQPKLETCTYSERCEDGVSVRSCKGTLENGVCTYNPAVSPSCSPCQ